MPSDLGTIDLYFKDTDGHSEYDRIVAFATGGPEVHVEAYLNGLGLYFSAVYAPADHSVPPGVHLMPGIDVTGPLWNCIKTPWRLTNEALKWAETRVGMPYDLEGAVSSATRRALHRANHYFCSDAAIELLSRCEVTSGSTLDPRLIPELLCPVGLKIAVTSMLSGESRDRTASRLTSHYMQRRSAKGIVSVESFYPELCPH